jgi:hypothetical protein
MKQRHGDGSSVWKKVPVTGTFFAALFCFFSKHLHIIYGLEKVSVLALM